MTVRDGSPAAYSTGVRIEHPGLTSADGADWWDVEVPFGETVRKDFTIVPGARLTGRVTDDEGRRWGDFDLRLIPDDPKASKIGAYYARTNHRGRFEVVEAIYPGRYQVQWNEPHADCTVPATIDLAAGTTTHLTIPIRITAEPREVKVEVQPAVAPDVPAAGE